MSVELLLSRQNPDGGWPYIRGKSWTEPTAYAALALHVAGVSDAASRGVRWLAETQRPDGGWAPQRDVDRSTWVTGLAALLPPQLLGAQVYERALGWLMSTTSQNTTAVYRIRQWLLGNPAAPERFRGWPWTPGAAAWVGPTAVAIFALDKARSRWKSPAISRRVDEGREFLLSKMCQEGGWNHGSARTLGYDAPPYPETTGMALAALRGADPNRVARGLDAANRFLPGCRSTDAANWLRLGLLAHGRLPENPPRPANTPRTLTEASLGLLVAQSEKGQALFWA